jgi:mono/diheme cytochrome c family protein
MARMGSQVPLLLIVFLALAAAAFLANGSSSGEELSDPFLGQPDAIAAGRIIYASKCYVCHHSAGARGPNLFATKLTDEQFLEVVINGRKGTQMPAFGLRLSPDEVWQVHAFIKSTDHY